MSRERDGGFSVIEIPEDLSRLETSLVNFYPESSQMMNILILKRLGKFPDSGKITICLYNDNFDNPFLVSIQEPNVHSTYGVVTWSQSAPTPEIMEAFESLISWDKSPCFSSNQMAFAPHLKALLDKRENFSKYSEGIPGVLYCINRYIQTSLDLPTIPPRQKAIPLSSTSAPRVVSFWKYAEPHSSDAIASCITPGCLPSVGIFLDEFPGDPVSFALLSPLGTINNLYTEEPHRGKGLGNLTIRCLSHSIAALNPLMSPVAEVEPHNSASRRLFQNCGFSYVCDTIWYYYSSKK